MNASHDANRVPLEPTNQTTEEASPLRLAALVHRSLLPSPVRSPRIDVDIRYRPVESVGGDYCQVRLPDPSICYITICDVCGHGIGPALLATRVSSEVRHFIRDRVPPREMVRLLNAFIYENFRETLLFLTFLAARIDLCERTLTYSGAGHPGPLWLRRSTESVEMLPSQNTVLGVLPDCLDDEPERTVEFVAGDRVVFYTDGLTEVVGADGEWLGEDGLARIASAGCSTGLAMMADHIIDQVNCHGRAEDDQTLIVAEMK